MSQKPGAKAAGLEDSVEALEAPRGSGTAAKPPATSEAPASPPVLTPIGPAAAATPPKLARAAPPVARAAAPAVTRSAASTPAAMRPGPAVPVVPPAVPAPPEAAAAGGAPAHGSAVVEAAPDAISLPSPADAEALLIAAAAGRLAADVPGQAAALRVIAMASEPERAALAGEQVPADPCLLRAGAALRLRLELALAAPARRLEPGAAQRVLADVDEMLARFKGLGEASSAETVAALDPMRLAVVDAGVKLAGALSRLVPERALVEQAPRPADRPGTRLLSNEVAQAGEAAPRSRKLLWIAFAFIVAATLSYHAWRLAAPTPLAAPTLPGAPANTYVVQQGATRILKAYAGTTVPAAELEGFKSQEHAKGNVVRDLGSGAWAIEPEHAAGPGERKP